MALVSGEVGLLGSPPLPHAGPPRPMPSPRRSILAVIVAAWLLALALPASVVAGSGRFVDDDGSRYESSIEAVARAGIMTACNAKGDRFCPKGEVSRVEMAVFLVRTFNLTATSGVRFKDVPRKRATAVDKVVTAGIATGMLEAPLLPRRRRLPGPDGRVRDEGAQAGRDERQPLRRRVRVQPLPHGHRPAGHGGPRDRLRRRPVLPQARHHPRRDRRLPPACPQHHQGHGGAARARESVGGRVRPARRRCRRFLVARPRDRQRDARQLHVGGAWSAPSPRAA